MPNFDVEFEVFCSYCKSGLCNQSEAGSGRLSYSRGLWVKVEPCQRCLEKARGEGFDEGYEKARQELSK
jgi:hypothetical protein